jgi:AcrR family transcriptional regulator
VADIARKIGMSPPNIYNFYPSRDAILEAVGEVQLTALRHRLAEETQRIEGDWPKIENLFLQTAHHLREHLENETDILQLQAMEIKHHWKFIQDFNDFLKSTARKILTDAMQAGRFRRQDPTIATTALFDCMFSALDLLQLGRIERLDHERRIKVQLDLLEHAFTQTAPPAARIPKATS